MPFEEVFDVMRYHPGYEEPSPPPTIAQSIATKKAKIREHRAIIRKLQAEIQEMRHEARREEQSK